MAMGSLQCIQLQDMHIILQTCKHEIHMFNLLMIMECIHLFLLGWLDN